MFLIIYHTHLLVLEVCGHLIKAVDLAYYDYNNRKLQLRDSTGLHQNFDVTGFAFTPIHPGI
jgi:hypothetical protein